MVKYLYHGLQKMDMRRLSSFLFRLERWVWIPSLSLVEHLYHGLQNGDTRRLSSCFIRLETESLSRPYHKFVRGGISTFNTM
jgi:hypothetical protein